MRGGKYTGRPEGYNDLPDLRAEHEKERVQRVVERARAKKAAKEANEKIFGQADRSAAEEERTGKKMAQNVHKAVVQAEVNTSNDFYSPSSANVAGQNAGAGVQEGSEGAQGDGEAPPRKPWWRLW